MSIIFLDRDGVINENRSDYVKSWGEFRFLPGSKEAIASLKQEADHPTLVSIRLLIEEYAEAVAVLTHHQVLIEFEQGRRELQR